MKKQHTQKTIDGVNEVCAAVVEHYIAQGEALTVKEIAEAMSWSPAKARRICDAIFDVCGWEVVALTDKEIAVRSKAYGTITGYRVVEAFTASKSYLAKMIREFRA